MYHLLMTVDITKSIHLVCLLNLIPIPINGFGVRNANLMF